MTIDDIKSIICLKCPLDSCGLSFAENTALFCFYYYFVCREEAEIRDNSSTVEEAEKVKID